MSSVLVEEIRMDTQGVNTGLAIVAALGAVGEVLSLIPSVKANGIFQLVYNTLKLLGGKKDG